MIILWQKLSEGCQMKWKVWLSIWGRKDYTWTFIIVIIKTLILYSNLRCAIETEAEDSKDSLITSACCVADESRWVEKMARKLASACTEEGLQKVIIPPYACTGTKGDGNEWSVKLPNIGLSLPTISSHTIQALNSCLSYWPCLHWLSTMFCCAVHMLTVPAQLLCTYKLPESPYHYNFAINFVAPLWLPAVNYSKVPMFIMGCHMW